MSINHQEAGALFGLTSKGHTVMVDRNPALPVLDDSTFDAMVLGFARTRKGALRVALKWAEKRGEEGVISVYQENSVRVTHDPDINTAAQADRANKLGRGWVIAVNPVVAS